MKLFHLISFLSFISLIQNSHIYSKDPIIDYSNAGFFSSLGIPFMLSSSLSSNEYLNLITSFSLHSQIQSTPSPYSISEYFTPSFLFMKLSSYSSECQIASLKTTAYAYTKSVDSTNYIIRFQDNQNNFIGLNSGFWYVLWINITDPIVFNMQIPNKLLQIQMSTVSSTSDNYINYDINPVISVFQLLDPPVATLQTTLSFENSGKQNILSVNNLVYIGKNLLFNFLY